MAYIDKYGVEFSNEGKMILAFENLLDESITKSVSIFDNPNTRKFIQQFKNELSASNAKELLEKCMDVNRLIYKQYDGYIPAQLYNDVESLMAAHGVLINGGEEDFEQITWLK